MVRTEGSFFIIICQILICISVSPAAEPEALFSENTSSIFLQQASEVYSEEPLESENIQQAMTLIEAAYALDPGSIDVPEQMLRIMAASCYTEIDYSKYFTWALSSYLGARADLETASGALRCLLEGLDTRSERESLLERLSRQHSRSSPFFASDLKTQLGLLVAEKADTQSALNYLSQAYQLNPYNQLAYSKFKEISSGQEDFEITYASRLIHLRRLLSVDPYDLDSASQYADGLLKLQLYDAASDAYGYVVQVFDLLYPNQPLPKEFVHAWLLCTYHSSRNRPNCLKIAETYRQADQIDLFLEALVGKTLLRLGQKEAGERILLKAVKKAEMQVIIEDAERAVMPEDLSWFYSFVIEHPEEALAWGNDAFQEDPNRSGVQVIFAYCLAMNGQNELARKYAEPFEDTDQIALLTMGIVQLSRDDKQNGLQTLKAVVEMAPETLVAEYAVRLLNDQGSDYIPSVSPDSVQKVLENGHPSGLVPEFVDPSGRFSMKLLFNGSDFLYGQEFPARLVIENTSSEPLIISDDAMLKGSLRVDVTLEGNLNVEIQNLLSKKFRPAVPVRPGKYISIPLDLNRGRLKKLLLTYPQADVWMNFAVTFDMPTYPSDSQLSTIQARIHRRGVEMTREYLIQRLDVLAKGQSGQKLQAASLFVGLLAEQKAFEMSHADFTHIQVERAILVDSIRKILSDEDWKIRVRALNSLVSVSMPLDQGILNEVSKNLNHEKWPVRLMAMYLLSKSQPDAFRKVLDWTAQYDAYPLNRNLAIALGGQSHSSEETDSLQQ